MVITLKIIKLRFLTALHIATPSDDYSVSHDTIHSDTLWSAIVHSWATLGINIPQNPSDTGFTNSSLFPFTEMNGKTVYFFPKPFVPFKIQVDDASDLTKKLKKVIWLDKDYYEACLHNKPLHNFGEANGHLQGEWLCTMPLTEELFVKDVVPRARVPRVKGEDTTIFYMERIYFSEKSGLYFILKCNNAETEKKVKAALNLLQSEGFGSDRNIGQGKFIWQEDSLQLNVPDNTQFSTNLSLYCPASPDELQNMLQGDPRFDLIKRGGWISDEQYKTLRKQSVYMFREGSVFSKSVNHDLPSETGGIINVTPPQVNMHPVWRNGRALLIPIQRT